MTSAEYSRLKKMYVWGFLISLGLTMTAYVLVKIHVDSFHLIFSHDILIPLLSALAFTQLATQLVFFLHIGEEAKPRWKLTTFLFAAGVVVIVVFGSLWIMANLDYHHRSHQLSPDETVEYIKDEELIHSEDDH